LPSGETTRTAAFPASTFFSSQQPPHVAEKLGRSFPYERDPKKPKDGIFVSDVHGRTVQDAPRSTIYIYRTHCGHYGNLLSKMLAMRPASAPKIIIQGDLSPSNYPEPLLLLRWVKRFVGCAMHARRPFKRYEDDDSALCDRMLELFALFTASENRIFAAERPDGEIVRLRQTLEKPIWEEIERLARSVLDADVASPRTASCSGSGLKKPRSIKDAATL
jgi:hypothetical protein